MRFVTETEFTLEEVLAIAQGDYFALAEQVGLANLTNLDPRNTQDVAGILFDTLLARCGSEVAVYALEGQEDFEKNRFLRMLLGFWLSSAPGWLDRLEAHDQGRQKGLLSGVKSSSTNRDYANDAPSIKDPAVEDLSHVSYFTKATAESETDMGTVASRIAEIDSVAKGIYSEWADALATRFSLGV